MRKIILEQFYKNRQGRFYEKYAPTIRAGKIGLLVIEFNEDDTDMCDKRNE